MSDTAPRTLRRVLPLIAAIGTAAPLHAQHVATLLPDSTAERLVAFYNSAFTTRLGADAHIAAGTTLQGGVAALAGTLTIDGIVEGDVVVINGDLDVRGAARINGSATVVGGELRVADGATVRGGTAVFREPLRYRHEGEHLTYVPPHLERGLAAGVDLPFGRTDVLVASRGAYNRAEGLAIAVGPRFRSTGAHRTSAEAFLIARTAAAAELDAGRFGYDVRAAQVIEPSLGIEIGARLYSLMTPIEAWGLPDREAALAAFVLRRDYRDHYERRGWSGHVRLARPGRGRTLAFEYRDERHRTAPPADPFTLFNRDDEWRPQPLIAQGTLRSVSATFDWDARNEERDPSTGWLLRATVERGLGGGITIPVSQGPDGEPVMAPDARSGFLTAGIDMRRYARLSPWARLNMRIIAAGSLDARALPPQRQHALGGEGSLPGYGLFAFDCGARDAAVLRGRQLYFPYYGCDRMALVQLEYQAAFPFARRIGERVGLGSLAHLARWVAFFDAGRAWIEPASRAGRPGGNDDFSVDAGLGVRFGPLGFYWAFPLSGRVENVNFFIRAGPRI